MLECGTHLEVVDQLFERHPQLVADPLWNRQVWGLHWGFHCGVLSVWTIKTEPCAIWCRERTVL
jgi:hypothetical protein